MTLRRERDDRGASLVEFALVAPVLFMMLFGMVTGGLALSHKLDLSTAARESARYAATLPANEVGSSDGADWAWDVAQEAISQSGGALNVSGAQICVALVTGSPAAAYSPTGGTAYFYSSSYPFSSTSGSGTNCYNDSSVNSLPRVQVLVQRPDSFQAIAFTKGLTLTAQADAQYESTP